MKTLQSGLLTSELGLKSKSKEERLPSNFELLRFIGQNGFLEFCMAVMPKYKATKFHIYLCNELQAMYESVLAGKDNNKIIEMQPQMGKQLADDTPVPTPKGFVRHGDLKPGDEVFHPSGKIIKVLKVFEPNNETDVEITFSGGAKIVCHENHEWYLYDHSRDKYRIVEAKELLKTPLGGGACGSTFRFKVDYNQPVSGEDKGLLVDPYVLGVWLGDGQTGKGTVVGQDIDKEIINHIVAAGYALNHTWVHKETRINTYAFKGLLDDLKRIGIGDRKDIPEQYLFADIESRRALLRGLMDTDGTVDASRGSNRYSFSNCNLDLIQKFIYLVRSLGYNPSVTKLKPRLSSSGIQGKQDVYTVSFSVHDKIIPFRLARKAQKCIYQSIRRRRGIVAVKKVAPQKGRCIQVDSPDGLYLASEWLIPTHNSTTTSVLFLAWVLGRSAVDDGEGWPVICASYGASLAEQKSSACRNIVNSDVYQIIFPGTRVDPETAAKDYWRTTSGGSYRAAGVGGALTGMPGKILIGDDLLKDRADADSETVRESTWDWFGPVFLSRRQEVSGVCLVNTRWHIDDVAGRVENQFARDKESDKKPWEYDHWQRLSFPAFAEEDEYINGQLFRRKGEVLCPERFSYETMVRRRNATETYDWNALYQQNPIRKENARFHAEWFRYFEPEEIKFKDLNYYTLVDLASSKAKRADNTVILTVGKERSTGMWFVLDYIFGHLDPGQTIDAIFEHVRMFPGTRVWVESVGYQSTLQYHVEEKQRKDLVFFEINPYLPKNTKSKESRIEGLVQPFKLGLIYFRKHMKELEDELLVFPQGRHDDIIDSLSMAQFVLPHTDVVETPEQKKKREREEKEGFDPFKPFNQV